MSIARSHIRGQTHTTPNINRSLPHLAALSSQASDLHLSAGRILQPTVRRSSQAIYRQAIYSHAIYSHAIYSHAICNQAIYSPTIYISHITRPYRSQCLYYYYYYYYYYYTIRKPDLLHDRLAALPTRFPPCLLCGSPCSVASSRTIGRRSRLGRPPSLISLPKKAPKRASKQHGDLLPRTSRSCCAPLQNLRGVEVTLGRLFQ